MSFFKKLSNSFFEQPKEVEDITVTSQPVEAENVYYLNQLLTTKSITIVDRNGERIDNIPLTVTLQENGNLIYLNLAYDPNQLFTIVKNHPDYATIPLGNIVFNGYSIKPSLNGPEDHPEKYFTYSLINQIQLFQQDDNLYGSTEIEVDYVESSDNFVTFVFEKDDLITYSNNVLAENFEKPVNATVTSITLSNPDIILNTRVMPYFDNPTDLIVHLDNTNYRFAITIPRQIKTLEETENGSVTPVLEPLTKPLPDGFTITSDDNSQLVITADLAQNETAKTIKDYLTTTNQTQTNLLLQYLLGMSTQEPNGLFNPITLETDKGPVSVTTPLEEVR